jgi:hypothetical protein
MTIARQSRGTNLGETLNEEAVACRVRPQVPGISEGD